MKKQTFIVILKDENGRMVTFERWAYKRLQTCINSMVKLCQHPLYKNDLLRTKTICAHKTEYESTEVNKVWEISIDEFMEMMKSNAYRW